MSCTLQRCDKEEEPSRKVTAKPTQTDSSVILLWYQHSQPTAPEPTIVTAINPHSEAFIHVTAATTNVRLFQYIANKT